MTDSTSTSLLTVDRTVEETNPDDEPPLSNNSSKDWYLLAPNQIASQLYSDAEHRLSHVEAEKRLKQCGSNTLTSTEAYV